MRGYVIALSEFYRKCRFIPVKLPAGKPPKRAGQIILTTSFFQLHDSIFWKGLAVKKSFQYTLDTAVLYY